MSKSMNKGLYALTAAALAVTTAAAFVGAPQADAQTQVAQAKGSGSGSGSAAGSGSGSGSGSMKGSQKGAKAKGSHAMGSTKGDQSESSKAYAAANAKMHSGMDITFSGDSDVDFVRGMIPHHAGAIDMAKVVLKHGKDAEVRKLAEEIIQAQEKEIAWMKEWLKKKGK